MDFYGLLRGGERLFPAAELAQVTAKVAQRYGKIGQERVGMRRRQPTVNIDLLLRGGERLFAPAEWLSLLPRLFSDVARSGRHASRCVAASLR
jgi:hypothetical protein